MRSRGPTSREIPGEGQESVWDYPRPPAIVPTTSHVRVVHHGVTIADTYACLRVLETSQPPAFYIPRSDVAAHCLQAGTSRSFCEWKGPATYWSIVIPPTPGNDGTVVPDAAWSYENPTPPFASIAGHVAFYARLVDECWVDEEQVVANPGSFYGGWITSKVVGPFKGDPGTEWW